MLQDFSLLPAFLIRQKSKIFDTFPPGEGLGAGEGLGTGEGLGAGENYLFSIATATSRAIFIIWVKEF